MVGGGMPGMPQMPGRGLPGMPPGMMAGGPRPPAGAPPNFMARGPMPLPLAGRGPLGRPALPMGSPANVARPPLAMSPNGAMSPGGASTMGAGNLPGMATMGSPGGMPPMMMGMTTASSRGGPMSPMMGMTAGAPGVSMMPMSPNATMGAANLGITTGPTRPPTSFGTLKINVAGCKNLPPAIATKSQKTYMRMRLGGDQEQRTAPAREGGPRPRFGDDLTLEVRMDREIEISLCLPSNNGTADDILGLAKANVMPWIAQGKFTGDLELKDAMFQPIGQVTLSVKFERSLGSKGGAAAAMAAATAGGAAGNGNPNVNGARDPNGLFTDDEIREAFTQFDLDKNSFVGAAEIRHILINIGENVSDEEVNEMIRMVDRSGDGQVSFPDFYRMVSGGKEPPAGLVASQQGGGGMDFGGSPSAPAFNSPSVKNLSSSPMSTDRSVALDGPAAVAAKQAKKTGLEDIVRQYGLTADGIRKAFEDFDAADKGEGTADYPTFCDALSLAPGPVSDRVFQVYDPLRTGSIDFREFCVAASNFTNASRDERIKFAYSVFDENADGVLTKEELVRVLKANHLASSEKEVMRKADTILAQADGGQDGIVSRSEFEKVAARFPNICFPATTAQGGKKL